jgi:hypothetical protein
MRAMVLFLGLALQTALAGGDGASVADTSGRREPGAELDFLINDEGRTTAVTPNPRANTTWIYWAAAGAAAACGGLSWYWYEANTKPATMRNEEVFSDAR